MTGIYSDTDNYEIHFIYYHDFPYQSRWKHRTIQDCFRFKSPDNRDTLRCREQTNLVRSGKLIKELLNEQKETGHVNLNRYNNEMNTDNNRAYIISITPFSQKNQAGYVSGNTLPVSGTFLHHVMNAKQYAFKDAHEVTEKITATPQHRFYLLNKRKFIPVKSVSSTDLMITSSGKVMHLADSKRYHLNAGNLKKPILVYNIETNNKHTYFVGKNKILVHNTCSGLSRTLKQMFNWRSRSVAAIRYKSTARSRLSAIKKFNHEATYNPDTKSIVVVSKYTDSFVDGAPRKSEFITAFGEDTVTLLKANKQPGMDYYASDIIKSQYEMVNRNYFPEHFNNNKVVAISIPYIINPATVNMLKDVESNTPEFRNSFLQTRCGKFAQHVAGTMNRKIISAGYSNSASSLVRSIRILLQTTW